MGMLTLPTILETLDEQSEELRNRLVVINEENGWMKRITSVLGAGTSTRALR